MIEDLLKANKISRYHYVVYALISTEFGREFFEKGMRDTFMAEPTQMDSGGIELAYLDGRRSVFRDMHRAIIEIEKKLKEEANG